MKKQRLPGDYRTTHTPTWCKGCSYFAVLSSLTRVLSKRNVDPAAVNVISGIGCSSRLPLFLSTMGMHTLHGRAVAVAAGARLARPDIPVIVAAGDGDLFSIGLGHFIHAARKNFDMTVLCLDNRMYAMTKHQVSPTSAAGCKGSMTPDGVPTLPMNVLELAITGGATFVARTLAATPAHLDRMIGAAFDHKGFSFVEILAPCRSFDRTGPLWSLHHRAVDINKTTSHTVSNRSAALLAASGSCLFDTDTEAPVQVGIFWKTMLPTFEQATRKGMPAASTARSITRHRTTLR
jgi:2-oxoglutarate/2-oxoacid ferredoxin oxidoreductase subunit beta